MDISNKYFISFFFGSILLLARCSMASNESQLRAENAALSDSLNKCATEFDSLNAMVKRLSVTANYWKDDRIAGNVGIDLIQNLKSRPELIPYEGILGGKMHFGNASLLGSRWVIAEFDDGHRQGKILLQYEITNDSIVKWKTLNHYLE